jgi:hypothetical protein
MTDKPSQWAIEQAVKLVAATLPIGTVPRTEEIEPAIDVLARALDAMRAANGEVKDGLGYGGVVRSAHDGD